MQQRYMKKTSVQTIMFKPLFCKKEFIYGAVLLWIFDSYIFISKKFVHFNFQITKNAELDPIVLQLNTEMIGQHLNKSDRFLQLELNVSVRNRSKMFQALEVAILGQQMSQAKIKFEK